MPSPRSNTCLRLALVAAGVVALLTISAALATSQVAASDPPDGPRFALDPTWGDHGSATWNLGVGPSPCTPLEHALLDDGGDLSVSDCLGDIVVDRTTPSGQRDTTYGDNGRARIRRQIASPKAYIAAGRVLVTHLQGALLIDPSGQTFSTWTIPAAFATGHFLDAAAIGVDGRATLAYRSGIADTTTYIRLTAAAQLDEAFGEHGIIVRAQQRRQMANVAVPVTSGFIDIAPDGTMTLAEQRSGTVLSVERIDANGDPVPTFGDGGVAAIDFGFVATAGLQWVRAPDGRTLFAATSFDPSGRRIFGVLTSDGRPDARIGSGSGVVRDGRGSASPQAFFTDDGTMVSGAARFFSAVVSRTDVNGNVTTTAVPISGEEGRMIGLDAAERPVFVVTDPKPFDYGWWEQPPPTVRVIRLTKELAVDRTFGLYGQVLLNHRFPSWNPGLVLADGRVRLFVDGVGQLDVTGHDDPTYSDRDPTADLLRGTNDALTSGGFDNLGRLVLIGTFGDRSARKVLATRYTVDGRRDTTFGTDGQADITMAIPLWVRQHYTRTRVVGFDGLNRIYLMAGEQNSTNVTVGPDSSQLLRLTASGAFDTTYTPTWLGTGGTSILRTDDVGRVLILWPGNDIGVPTTITRLLPSGATDTSYGTIEVAPSSRGLPSHHSIAVLPRASGLTLCSVQACRRFDDAGRPVLGFGNAGTVMLSDLDERLVDGRGMRAILDSAGAILLQSGRLLARIDRSGRLDATFGIGGIVELPDLGRTVNEDSSWNQIALDGDGVILTGRIKPTTGMSTRRPAEFATRITDRGIVDEEFGDGGTLELGVGTFAETYWLRTFGDGVLQWHAGGLRAIDSRGRIKVVQAPDSSVTFDKDRVAFLGSANVAADGFAYPSSDFAVEVYAALDDPVESTPSTTTTTTNPPTTTTTTTTPPTTTTTTAPTTSEPATSTTVPASTTVPVSVTPGYAPVGPARVLDTRRGERTADALQEGIGVRAAGTVTVVPIRGRVGLGDDVGTVALTVTATDSAGDGFVTVYPCDGARPLASNLNTSATETVANAVVTALSSDGSVCLYNSVETHLVVDVSGSTSADAELVGVTPSRLLDTRDRGAKIQSLGTERVAVRGQVGVGQSPAVVLNVTTTGASRDGYVTVHPCGTARPSTSNLNVRAGVTSANVVVVDVGTDGAVCVYSSVDVHVVVDLDAVVAHAVTRTASPQRLLDTRASAAGRPSAGTVTRVHLADTSTAAHTSAAVLNVTMVQPRADGYLTVYPCDRDRPLASSVNAVAGAIVPNLVLAAADRSGDVCIFNSSESDLVVDLIGTIG